MTQLVLPKSASKVPQKYTNDMLARFLQPREFPFSQGDFMQKYIYLCFEAFFIGDIGLRVLQISSYIILQWYKKWMIRLESPCISRFAFGKFRHISFDRAATAQTHGYQSGHFPPEKGGIFYKSLGSFFALKNTGKSCRVSRCIGTLKALGENISRRPLKNTRHF